MDLTQVLVVLFGSSSILGIFTTAYFGYQAKAANIRAEEAKATREFIGRMSNGKQEKIIELLASQKEILLSVSSSLAKLVDIHTPDWDGKERRDR